MAKEKKSYLNLNRGQLLLNASFKFQKKKKKYFIVNAGVFFDTALLPIGIKVSGSDNTICSFNTAFQEAIMLTFIWAVSSNNK